MLRTKKRKSKRGSNIVVVKPAEENTDAVKLQSLPSFRNHQAPTVSPMCIHPESPEEACVSPEHEPASKQQPSKAEPPVKTQETAETGDVIEENIAAIVEHGYVLKPGKWINRLTSVVADLISFSMAQELTTQKMIDLVRGSKQRHLSDLCVAHLQGELIIPSYFAQGSACTDPRNDTGSEIKTYFVFMAKTACIRLCHFS